jgi:aryl-alcohol dehydrogenase-like predicted oxidoreductase
VAHLGKTELDVFRLCLGGNVFGWTADESESFAVLDAYAAAGGNFIDTADTYMRPNMGTSEAIIGRWMASRENRDDIVLATKVGSDGGLSAANIREHAEASLRRLQTDRIDLYQMHHVDLTTPWDEIWEAFGILKAQGKVLYVGSSNHAGWHIAKGMEASRRRGGTGLVSEQSIYNLLTRTVELEVLPACQDYGLGVIPWSPLHGGLLGGIIRKTEQGKRRLTGRAKDTLKGNRKAIKAWEDLCDELGENPADVGLAWLLAQPGVTAPIIGPRTMAQLDGAQRALKVRLTKDVLARLDEIFPGPGGPAPEAYAW